MCMFCAAIPLAAATGVTLNANQLKAKREAEEAGLVQCQIKPVIHVTAGVVVLLLIGSATYHSLMFGP